jgi:hypothetical protein
MAVAELTARAPRAAALNPFRVRGTALPPNVLLAAKIVALVFVLSGNWHLTDHYLPFLGFLNHVGSPSAFQHALQAIWLVATVSLLCNQFVRASCVTLGCTLLLAQLASMPYRTNNLTFTALLLLLIGLSDKHTAKTFIRAQFVVLYFWGAMNKLLDVNWRDGGFFESWVGIHAYGPAYHHLASLLPSMVLSKIASWAVIVTEFAISATFLVRRLVPVGILLVVAYHSSLFLITGTTFTMFWFSLTAGALALVDWPEERPTVQFAQAGRFARIAGWLKRLDLGHELDWQRSPDSEFHLASSKGLYSGRPALARALLYSPALYLILYALAGPYEPARRWAAVVALAVFVWGALELARGKRSARAHTLDSIQAQPPLVTAP